MSAVQTAMLKKKYLTTDEVCRVYSIGRSTLYQKISEHCKGYDETYPTPIKIGRSTLWCDERLEAYYKAKFDKDER
mgnify:FL=1